MTMIDYISPIANALTTVDWTLSTGDSTSPSPEAIAKFKKSMGQLDNQAMPELKGDIEKTADKDSTKTIARSAAENVKTPCLKFSKASDDSEAIKDIKAVKAMPDAQKTAGVSMTNGTTKTTEYKKVVSNPKTTYVMKSLELPKTDDVSKAIDALKTIDASKAIEVPKVADAPKTADVPKGVDAPTTCDVPEAV